MLYIIIPVHNRKEYTKNCLASLTGQTYKDFKIVVIDDGSTDGTSDLIASDFPEVKVLKGDGNLWWTKATNKGVVYALENGAEYVLTLNNDTICRNDFLNKMIYWIEKYPKAILGAFAVDADSKTPLYGGEIINWKKAASKYLLDIIPKNDWHGLHEVTHYPGRGLLIPKNVFNDIGYFDEKHFPHYIADYDFTHRAKRIGYKIFCNYDAIIYTYPTISGSQALRYKKNILNYYSHLFGIKGGGNLKNFFYYAIKNCPRKYLFIYLFNGTARRILGYFIH